MKGITRACGFRARDSETGSDTMRYERGTRYALVAYAAAILMIATGLSARAATETKLILNGDLSRGSEQQPDDWRTEAWSTNPPL